MQQKTYMVPALERGLRILELLAGHPEGLRSPCPGGGMADALA